MSQPLITPDNSNDPANASTGRANISAERFISPDYMAGEMDNIWSKMWLVAGVASDVQEPGDYFVFNLGSESILVSRTHSGELAAMYNVCQHRGARVMVNDMGAIDAFVCPYHGWTYDLDGTLKTVPDEDRFSQGAPCDKLSLPPVRVESWGAMIWICMDDDVSSNRRH